MQGIFSKLLAEFIGTMTMVFLGCGSVMVAERMAGSVSTSAVPVVFGLAVSCMIYAVGHISGAHFNPAVTVGFAFGRHFPKNQVLPYWFAQFSGALFAISLLHFLLPEGQSYGATTFSVMTAQAFFWEVLLSFFLMFVIMSVATDTRSVGTMAGAAIGATVMICAFVGGPVTGASMNPARTLAPNLFQGELSVLWVYLSAPFVGTILAALTYNKIRCTIEAEDAQGCC